MKKLTLKLGGTVVKLVSKDEMKKIKGGGGYGCEEHPPVNPNECFDNKWMCVDTMSNPPCTFFACGEVNPTDPTAGISCLSA